MIMMVSLNLGHVEKILKNKSMNFYREVEQKKNKK
jgi:hypothetical protein